SGLGVACGAMALLALNQGDLDAAIVWGNRSVELARAFDDDWTEVESMISVGAAEIFRDGVDARKTLEDALELARANDLVTAEARVLNDLAFAGVEFRDYDLASRSLDAGLALCAELDLDLWRLSMLAAKARAELNRGRWTEAAEVASFLASDLHDSPGPKF